LGGLRRRGGRVGWGMVVAGRVCVGGGGVGCWVGVLACVWGVVARRPGAAVV
jgi:hypothetical protein